MDWLRLVGFCLLAASLVMVLRQMQPQIAGLLSAVFGVLVMSVLLAQVKEYVQMLGTFLSSLNLDAQYYKVMLKATGIVLITQLAVQMCIDMDAPSVARRAQICGRLALFGVAVPVFMEMTQMAVNVLR